MRKTAYFIIIASFLLAYLGGGEIPYLIFYMLSGGIILSCLWIIRVYKLADVIQRIDRKTYYAGDKIKIDTFVENDSMLPVPYIEIYDKTKEKVSREIELPYVGSILPMSTASFSREFSAVYRGIYTTGPVSIVFRDILGFFTITKSDYSKNNFKVYPRVYDIEKLGLKSMQPYGSLSTKLKAFEDNTSISDIKKYQIGDSVKKIHWKISAKKGSLFVKNYEMMASVSAYVFLDFHNNCYRGSSIRDVEERAVETAASVVYYFLKNTTSVFMYINASEINYVKGRELNELNKFLDVLCEVKTCGERRMKTVLEKRIRTLNSRASIIVVTGDIDEEDERTYHSIKDMGFDIIIIYIGNKDKDMGRIRKLLENNLSVFTQNDFYEGDSF